MSIQEAIEKNNRELEALRKARQEARRYHPVMPERKEAAVDQGRSGSPIPGVAQGAFAGGVTGAGGQVGTASRWDNALKVRGVTSRPKPSASDYAAKSLREAQRRAGQASAAQILGIGPTGGASQFTEKVKGATGRRYTPVFDTVSSEAAQVARQRMEFVNKWVGIVGQGGVNTGELAAGMLAFGKDGNRTTIDFADGSGRTSFLYHYKRAFGHLGYDNEWIMKSLNPDNEEWKVARKALVEFNVETSPILKELARHDAFASTQLGAMEAAGGIDALAASSNSDLDTFGRALKGVFEPVTTAYRLESNDDTAHEDLSSNLKGLLMAGDLVGNIGLGGGFGTARGISVGAAKVGAKVASKVAAKKGATTAVSRALIKSGGAVMKAGTKNIGIAYGKGAAKRIGSEIAKGTGIEVASNVPEGYVAITDQMNLSGDSFAKAASDFGVAVVNTYGEIFTSLLDDDLSGEGLGKKFMAGMMLIGGYNAAKGYKRASKHEMSKKYFDITGEHLSDKALNNLYNLSLKMESMPEADRAKFQSSIKKMQEAKTRAEYQAAVAELHGYEYVETALHKEGDGAKTMADIDRGAKRIRFHRDPSGKGEATKSHHFAHEIEHAMEEAVGLGEDVVADIVAGKSDVMSDADFLDIQKEAYRAERKAGGVNRAEYTSGLVEFQGELMRPADAVKKARKQGVKKLSAEDKAVYDRARGAAGYEIGNREVVRYWLEQWTRGEGLDGPKGLKKLFGKAALDPSLAALKSILESSGQKDLLEFSNRYFEDALKEGIVKKVSGDEYRVDPRFLEGSKSSSPRYEGAPTRTAPKKVNVETAPGKSKQAEAASGPKAARQKLNLGKKKPSELSGEEIASLEFVPLEGDGEGGTVKPGALKEAGEILKKRGRELMAKPEFRNWFGGSKITYKDGTPRPIYHGTDKDFSEFKKFGQSAEAGFHAGSFYQAASFADPNRYGGDTPKKAKVYPLYAKVENPLEVEDLGTFDGHTISQYIDRTRGNGDTGLLERVAEVTQEYDNGLIGDELEYDRRIIEAIKQSGYDGLIYRNTNESFLDIEDELGPQRYEQGDHYEDSVMVFDASQFKSATGNQGTFDPADPDLRRSVDFEEEGGQLEPITEGELGRVLARKMLKDELEAKTKEFRKAYENQPPHYSMLPPEERLVAATAEVLKKAANKVDTPEFRKWFGDSVAVEADGTPMRFYHGTNALEPFSTFSVPQFEAGSHFGTIYAASYFASKFGGYRAMHPAFKGRVYPVYLRMEKPLYIDQDPGITSRLRVINEVHKLKKDKTAWVGVDNNGQSSLKLRDITDPDNPKLFHDDPRGHDAFLAFMDANGFDSIVYRNYYEHKEAFESIVNKQRIYDHKESLRQSPWEEIKLDEAVKFVDPETGEVREYTTVEGLMSGIAKKVAYDEKFEWKKTNDDAPSFGDYTDSLKAGIELYMRDGAWPSGGEVVEYMLAPRRVPDADDYISSDMTDSEAATVARFYDAAMARDEVKKAITSGLEFPRANFFREQMAMVTNESSVVVLRPEQIKSAIGNNGKFSSDDPDIRQSIDFDEDVPAAVERIREQGDDGIRPLPDEPRARVVHFSDVDGLTELDVARAFESGDTNPNQPRGVWVYLEGHGLYEPLVARRRHVYEGEIDPRRVYDIADNPLGLWTGNVGESEAALQAAGFIGYRNGFRGYEYPGAVKLFENIPVALRGPNKLNRRLSRVAPGVEAIPAMASPVLQNLHGESLAVKKAYNSAVMALLDDSGLLQVHGLRRSRWLNRSSQRLPVGDGVYMESGGEFSHNPNAYIAIDINQARPGDVGSEVFAQRDALRDFSADLKSVLRQEMVAWGEFVESDLNSANGVLLNNLREPASPETMKKVLEAFASKGYEAEDIVVMNHEEGLLVFHLGGTYANDAGVRGEGPGWKDTHWTVANKAINDSLSSIMDATGAGEFTPLDYYGEEIYTDVPQSGEPEDLGADHSNFVDPRREAVRDGFLSAVTELNERFSERNIARIRDKAEELGDGWWDAEGSTRSSISFDGEDAKAAREIIHRNYTQNTLMPKHLTPALAKTAEEMVRNGEGLDYAVLMDAVSVPLDWSHNFPAFNDDFSVGLVHKGPEGLKGKALNNIKTYAMSLFSDPLLWDSLQFAGAAGEGARHWYFSSGLAIADVFGTRGAYQFSSLLAATSPRSPVLQNLRMALKTWAAWEAAGRPTAPQEIWDILDGGIKQVKKFKPDKDADGKKLKTGKWVIEDKQFYNHVDLQARVNNTIRAFAMSDQEIQTLLSGAKVNNFQSATWGQHGAMTIDVWMARLLSFIDEKTGKKIDPTSSADYPAFSGFLRLIAQSMDDLPSHYQETAWSFARTAVEAVVKGDAKSIAEFILTRETGDIVPDAFSDLMRDPKVIGLWDEIGVDADNLPNYGTRRETDASFKSVPLRDLPQFNDSVLEYVSAPLQKLAEEQIKKRGGKRSSIEFDEDPPSPHKVEREKDGKVKGLLDVMLNAFGINKDGTEDGTWGARKEQARQEHRAKKQRPMWSMGGRNAESATPKEGETPKFRATERKPKETFGTSDGDLTPTKAKIKDVLNSADAKRAGGEHFEYGGTTFRSVEEAMELADLARTDRDLKGRLDKKLDKGEGHTQIEAMQMGAAIKDFQARVVEIADKIQAAEAAKDYTAVHKLEAELDKTRGEMSELARVYNDSGSEVARALAARAQFSGTFVGDAARDLKRVEVMVRRKLTESEKKKVREFSKERGALKDQKAAELRSRQREALKTINRNKPKTKGKITMEMINKCRK